MQLSPNRTSITLENPQQQPPIDKRASITF